MTTSQISDADKLDTSKAIPRFIWLFAVALNTMVVMGGMLLLGTQLNEPGVGILWDIQEGALETSHVYPNSPAEKAGIQRGDLIIAVNGEALNLDPEESFTLAPGDTVELTIERDGETREVTVTREPGWIDFFSIGGLVSGLPFAAIQIMSQILDIVFFVVFLGVSAILFWKRADNPVILLMSVTLLFIGANFTLGYQGYYDVSPTLYWINFAHNIITSLLAVLTLLLTPDWRFVPAWSWALPVILVVATILNLVGIIGYDVVVYIQLAVFILAAILLYLRYRNMPESPHRELMRPFLIGVAFILAAYVLFNLADYLLIPMLFAYPWDAWAYLVFWGNIAQMIMALVLPLMLWTALRRETI